MMKHMWSYFTRNRIIGDIGGWEQPRRDGRRQERDRDEKEVEGIERDGKGRERNMKEYIGHAIGRKEQIEMGRYRKGQGH